MILPWLRLCDHFRSHAARKRLERATQARIRIRSIHSELATFGLLGVVSLVASFGFIFGMGPHREFDDRVFSLALSLASLWNFFLFFCRFGHYAAILGDIDCIDRLRLVVREGPPTGQLLRMQWKGQRPANDH